jgi:hypothetical protein
MGAKSFFLISNTGSKASEQRKSQRNKEEAHGFSRGRNPTILVTNHER